MSNVYSHPAAFRSSERNFFIVSGLPPDFNWQRLKDLVRKCTTNQPGWTNMDESWRGADGKMGYFSVRTDEDAARVYALLTTYESNHLRRPLLVHHWDVSLPSAVLLRCNCSAVYPGTNGHSPARSHISVQSVFLALVNWPAITQTQGAPIYVSMPPQYPAVSAPASTSMAPVHHNGQLPQTAYYQQRPGPTVSAGMPPVYNQHGIPVNVSNGLVRTEERSVHISNLHFAISETELRELMRAYGQPMRFDMKKGSASVQFGSTDEARRTIEGLRGREYRGLVLRARFDRDTTPVSEPVIVNGGPQRRER